MQPGPRTDNLTTFICRLSRNSEASISYSPHGLYIGEHKFWPNTVRFPTCGPRNMSDRWASFIGSINSSGQRYCVTGYLFTDVLSQLSRLIYKGRKAEDPLNKTTTLCPNVGKKVSSDEGSHVGSTDTCGITKVVVIWEYRHNYGLTL